MGTKSSLSTDYTADVALDCGALISLSSPFIVSEVE